MRDLCSIKDVIREVHRLETELKDGHGLTLNEGLCLCCVSQITNTPGECAEQLGVSPSRVSRIVNSLEKKGYLERRFSPDDRRSTDLLITDEGVDKLRELRGSGFTFSRLDRIASECGIEPAEAAQPREAGED